MLIGVPKEIKKNEYRAAGAEIIGSAKELFSHCEMIVKVKEPQPDESRMLREGQLLFAYLHLAPDPAYVIDDIGHYCVANRPGAVARTSTFALKNVTLSFAQELGHDYQPATQALGL